MLRARLRPDGPAATPRRARLSWLVASGQVTCRLVERPALATPPTRSARLVGIVLSRQVTRGLVEAGLALPAPPRWCARLVSVAGGQIVRSLAQHRLPLPTLPWWHVVLGRVIVAKQGMLRAQLRPAMPATPPSRRGILARGLGSDYDGLRLIERVAAATPPRRWTDLVWLLTTWYAARRLVERAAAAAALTDGRRCFEALPPTREVGQHIVPIVKGPEPRPWPGLLELLAQANVARRAACDAASPPPLAAWLGRLERIVENRPVVEHLHNFELSAGAAPCRRWPFLVPLGEHLAVGLYLHHHQPSRLPAARRRHLCLPLFVEDHPVGSDLDQLHQPRTAPRCARPRLGALVEP